MLPMKLHQPWEVVLPASPVAPPPLGTLIGTVFAGLMAAFV